MGATTKNPAMGTPVWMMGRGDEEELVRSAASLVLKMVKRE